MVRGVHWGCCGAVVGAPSPRRTLMLDLLYIGITIVVFAVLWLLVKGVEHFEH
jgi:hypothetical protein